MTPILLVGSLEGGGLERVCVTICNQWHLEGKAFKLIALHGGGPLVGALSSGIDLELWPDRTRASIGRMAHVARKYAGMPLLAFSTEIAMALGLLKRLGLIRNPTLYREPNAAKSNISRSAAIAYRTLISRMDLLIAQTTATTHDLLELTRFRGPLRIIPNPCRFATGDRTRTMKFPRMEHPPLSLLAVGRLTPQKGYDRLLRAVAVLLRAGVDVRLQIAGQGPLQTELLQQATELGIGDRVSFLGFVANPDALYPQADALVLSSYYEGLPNVVIESILCGCPAIVADGRGGTLELMSELGLADYIVRGTFEDHLLPAIERLKESDGTVWQLARQKLFAKTNPAHIAALFWRALEEACAHAR